MVRTEGYASSNLMKVKRLENNAINRYKICVDLCMYERIRCQHYL